MSVTCMSKPQQGGNGHSMLRIAFLLFITGIVTIILSTMFVAVARIFSDNPAGFAAFILIGPFPIVIEAGPQTVYIVLLGIV